MICQTMLQMNVESKIKRLIRRREQLRLKLKDHFSLPFSERNYQEFERVIDELDEVRSGITKLKGRP